MKKKKYKAGNVSTEMEHVSTGTTNIEEDSKGISYLQYVPRSAYTVKLKKKLQKAKKDN